MAYDQKGTGVSPVVCAMEVLEPRCLLSAITLFSAPHGRITLSGPPKTTDDYGSTFETASVVSMAANGSASIPGKIEIVGDVDVFAITATQTGTLTVQMVAATNRRGVDSYLRVYDSNQSLLAENDDSGRTLNSEVTLSVTAGSVYYVQASAYGRTTGAYTVNLSTVVSPTPTPTPTPAPTSVVLPGADAYSAGTNVAGEVLSTTSGDVLVILGTDSDDTMSIAKSGGTITVTLAGGDILTFTDANGSTFVGLAIYGFGGDDTITTTYSLSSSLSEVVYAGAGNDKIYENSPVAATVYGQDDDDLIVTVGGGADTVYGGAGSDSYWAGSNDTLSDVATAETTAMTVHRITSFVQPTRVVSQAVSLEIAGQDIVDPTASYAYSSRFVNQPLFADGAQYNDIIQGDLGDCYLLAGLSGIAQTDANIIEQSITALGDGTYAVRFYRNGAECYYRIDAQLPTDGSIPAYADLTRNGSELWVALLEKAFAQFRSGRNSYASIEGGYLDEAYTAISGMSYTSYQTRSLTANALAQRIQSDLNAGHAVTAGSTSTNSPIIGSHAYEIHAVDYDTTTSTWYVTVYNPWGVDGATWDTNPGDGLLRLTAAQFKARFSYLDVSVV